MRNGKWFWNITISIAIAACIWSVWAESGNGVWLNSLLTGILLIAGYLLLPFFNDMNNRAEE